MIRSMPPGEPTKDSRIPPKGPDSGKCLPRRPYRSPELVDYGPIARLTAGGSGVMTEPGMSGMPVTSHP